MKTASRAANPAPSSVPSKAGVRPADEPFSLPDLVLRAPFDSPGGPGLRTEWLLTDGRGGFSMGTVAGVPTRRYHALLIAAMRPPVGRTALLNATVDQLIINPDSPAALPVDLSSFRFAGAGERLHPDGASRLTRFTRSTQVQWVYDLPVARITRTLHLHRDRVACTLRYTVDRRRERDRVPGNGSAGGAALRLTVRPLVSLRDMHALIRRGWADTFSVAVHPDGRAARVDRDGITTHLRTDAGAFRHDPQWWFEFFYPEDAARGQDCIEDLFSPGVFVLDLPPGEERAEFLFRASTDELPAPNLEETDRDRGVRSRRLDRAASHISGRTTSASPEERSALLLLIAAADDFVVSRPAATGRGVSVIAGYPWFSDWGRDTFISLPGLMIATGRLDDARDTLLAFAAHRRHGLIPNVFNDQTGDAEYNTVDGSLWFIQAACAWREAAPDADDDAWITHLLPACLDIIAHYRRGTDDNIAMDPFDKLVTAGTSATQLTWMDARRDGVTFTPRHGKPVEINALWISGLRRLAALMTREHATQAANLSDLAEAAARSFRRSFWNDQASCLFDVLTPSDSERGPVAWTPDASIRPNQIFAVSLPHSPLAPEQQRAVLECVKSRLLTPLGVRTLDTADARYRGRYEGNLFQRDSAYHQGTAWPWLLGPVAEAILRVGCFSATARDEAMAVLRPVLAGVSPDFAPSQAETAGGCLGHIAEIFDGDPPQRPQGCTAQAWSAAELLRVLVMIRSESTGTACA